MYQNKAERDADCSNGEGSLVGGGVGQEPLVSKLKAVSNSTGNKNISFFDNCVDVLNISDRFCMMCRNCKWPGSTVVLECFY